MSGKQRIEPIEVGLGCYRREDWNRLLAMFLDRDELHDTYDAWLAEVERAEKRLKRQGHIVKRTIVDPDDLAVWCAVRGVQPVAAARAEYISEKTREESESASRRSGVPRKEDSPP